MTSAMTTYDQMRTAIQACVNIDDAVEVRNKAMGLETYVRAATDKEPLQWVSEIRMRAERKVGEMLKEMVMKGERDAGKGGNRRSRCPQDIVKPTLAQFNISGRQSSRWQKVASVSHERFEKAVTAIKGLGRPLSTCSVMRELKLESDLKSKGRFAKPMTGPKGKAMHAALDAVAQTNTSMVAMYTRLLLRELRAHPDLNPEERELLDELVAILQQREALP